MDLDLLRRHCRTGTLQNWNDRGTDFYSLRYKEGGRERTVGVRED